MSTAKMNIFGREIDAQYDKQTGNVITVGRVNQRELDEIIRLFKLADPFLPTSAAEPK